MLTKQAILMRHIYCAHVNRAHHIHHNGVARHYATIKRVSSRSSGGGYVFLAIPLITFGLGTWQVQRLFEKQELLARVEEKMHGQTIPLPQTCVQQCWVRLQGIILVQAEACQGLEYQQVRVEGTFEHDKEMHVIPRLRKDNGSKEAGAYVVTPFKRADTGERILVQRGWVPWASKDPAARPEGQLKGTVALTGIVRKGESSRTFTPDNKPEKNEWYWQDVPTMASLTGSLPVLIDATADMTPAGGYPAGGQTSIDIRNEHMQYILTWYSLCALTSFYCYNLIRRRWR